MKTKYIHFTVSQTTSDCTSVAIWFTFLLYLYWAYQLFWFYINVLDHRQGMPIISWQKKVKKHKSHTWSSMRYPLLFLSLIYVISPALSADAIKVGCVRVSRGRKSSSCPVIPAMEPRGRHISPARESYNPAPGLLVMIYHQDTPPLRYPSNTNYDEGSPQGSGLGFPFSNDGIMISI